LFAGGLGSQGGKGRRCGADMIAGTIVCYDEGVWDTRAPSGPPGSNGSPGTSKEIINEDLSYFSFALLSRYLFRKNSKRKYSCPE